MGVDVQLYALVDPTPAELKVANEFWGKHVPNAIFDDYKPRDEQLEYVGIDHKVIDYPGLSPEPEHWPRVTVNTLQRYPMPGYRPWAWPSCFQAIKLLEATFPGAVICFGGDGHWWCDPVTEDYIDEMWAAWYAAPEDRR